MSKTHMGGVVRDGTGMLSYGGLLCPSGGLSSSSSSSCRTRSGSAGRRHTEFSSAWLWTRGMHGGSLM